MLTADRKYIHLSPVFLDTEKALLDTLTKDHVLSVTHINNFLHVDKGGPMLFLENNLLRFPQAKTASSGFGIAMHSILNQSLLFLKKEKKYPSLETVKNWYKEALVHERLSRVDYPVYLERGLANIPLIYTEKILTLTGNELGEVDFKHEGIVLTCKDGKTRVPLSGKIDLMRFGEGKDVWLCDFKTGKEKKNWTGKDDMEKIQLHFNRQQLVFYKMLMARAKNFKDYNVLGGQLEFLETKGETLIDLSTEITDEEVERLEKLICAVHCRIAEHNFTIPDTVKGLTGMEAIEKFEEYLLHE